MKQTHSNFSIESILNSHAGHLNQHLKIVQAKKRKSKFGNNKKEIDGIIFDSEREAKRYGELKLLRKAGEIGLIELQVPFELNEGGSHSLKYIADFVYLEVATGEKIVEDVKGFRNRIYLKKKRLMKKVHGISIKET